MQGRDFIMNNCIGIDISKLTFNVHFTADGSDHAFDYTPDDMKKFVDMATASEPELIVMEATGGYEIDLAAELKLAKLPVAVVNPKRIRDFAKATGQTAKTDKIDARIIAMFGVALKPPVRETTDETTNVIKELVARRRQLTGMLVAEKNRTEHARDDVVKQSVVSVISAIESQISDIEKRISELVQASPEIKQKCELIESVPGIGKTTAATLVCGLPEIGSLNRRQVASLTGTAPINRDSGQFRGKRITGGGRREVRTALFMPTLSAIRWNPVIRNYYNHLISAGKSKMVAVVACMRKLIVILNSMVAKKEAWNPDFV